MESRDVTDTDVGKMNDDSCMTIHIVWPDPLASRYIYGTVYSAPLLSTTGYKTPVEGAILCH